jgi:hypothetical protein
MVFHLDMNFIVQSLLPLGDELYARVTTVGVTRRDEQFVSVIVTPFTPGVYFRTTDPESFGRLRSGYYPAGDSPASISRTVLQVVNDLMPPTAPWDHDLAPVDDEDKIVDAVEHVVDELFAPKLFDLAESENPDVRTTNLHEEAP